MKVVHYYARYRTHRSGVTDAIDHWTSLAARAGRRVAIVGARARPARPLDPSSARWWREAPHVGAGRRTWMPWLFGHLRRGDLLYLHEGWVISNLAAAIQGRVAGATVVVMPHGVYEPPLVRRLSDPTRLRLAAERWVLRLADWVHVFYPTENVSVARVAGREPRTCVLPNGAPLPAVAHWHGGGEYYLWMGRYDIEHKGIDRLLRWWAALPSPRPRLVLAGPDFRGGRSRAEALVVRLGLEGTVSLRGKVTGQEKAELMSGCRAYLHPSRWESCSILLLEMLGAGVPTLVERSIHAAAPLAAAGVVVTVDFDDLRDGSAVLSGVVDDVGLGERARAWVRDEGSWDQIGQEYVEWLDGVTTSVESR